MLWQTFALTDRQLGSSSVWKLNFQCPLFSQKVPLLLILPRRDGLVNYKLALIFTSALFCLASAAISRLS